MILARRMCANEPHELEKVEMAFLSHRSELNPLMTLFSVANGLPAPVLVKLIFYSNNRFFVQYFRIS